MTRKLYQSLAQLLVARLNCIDSGNDEWLTRHTLRLRKLVETHLPSGGGFDAGTSIDVDASTPEKLVFRTSFHHMDDHGYTGWTEHTVTVRASLAFEIRINISGANRHDIKDHIHECFYSALKTEVSE